MNTRRERRIASFGIASWALATFGWLFSWATFDNFKGGTEIGLLALAGFGAIVASASIATILWVMFISRRSQ